MLLAASKVTGFAVARALDASQGRPAETGALLAQFQQQVAPAY